jgi:acetyl-CoA acetyltransferase
MLGLCEIGEGGPFVADGETALTGSMPINPSGGLVSRGHPIGGTGLAMAHELVTQLRGEAGQRQVAGAEIALEENGGGIIGMEEAVAVVSIFART